MKKLYIIKFGCFKEAQIQSTHTPDVTYHIEFGDVDGAVDLIERLETYFAYDHSANVLKNSAWSPGLLSWKQDK
jgi:hypothetical protein